MSEQFFGKVIVCHEGNFHRSLRVSKVLETRTGKLTGAKLYRVSTYVPPIYATGPEVWISLDSLGTAIQTPLWVCDECQERLQCKCRKTRR